MSDVNYTRVNWEDSPSTNTPINSANLNKMDKGISDCATAINAANSAISGKQPITDNTLNTESKTVPGSINELNTNLGSLKFRIKNNVAQYSIDGGSTWSGLGGGSMVKAVYRGTKEISSAAHSVTVTHNKNVNTSKSHITIYGVGQQHAASTENKGVYVDNVTANSFDIVWVVNNGNIASAQTFSWEIIEFE